MFFSCADWETQIKQTQTNEEVFYPSVETAQIFNKRQTKSISKFGQSSPEAKLTEFDVDLVMNKAACLVQTEKIVSTKPLVRFNTVSQFDRPALNLETSKQGSQAFQDLCLSPMSRKSSNPTTQKF